MTGPVLSSMIYAQVGYFYTMIIFGCIMLVGLIVSYFLIPKDINFTAVNNKEKLELEKKILHE